MQTNVLHYSLQPDAIFADRLAPDTLVLDLKLTDRNNLGADVDGVYDPPNSGGKTIYQLYLKHFM